jgi:hypothetical protein
MHSTLEEKDSGPNDLEQTGSESTGTESNDRNPSLSAPNAELVARADERLAHAYDQIARADEQLALINEQLSRRDHDSTRQLGRTHSSRVRPAVRGLIGLLLAGGIGVAAFAAQSSYGDAARPMIHRWIPYIVSAPSLSRQDGELTAQFRPAVQLVTADLTLPQSPQAPSQGTALANAPNVAELALMLQTTSSDLANLQQDVEQLKTSQQQFVRDMTQVSEQLKEVQTQMTRDNASVAGQIKMVQDQVAGLVATASEQNQRLKSQVASPRPAAATAGKPARTVPPPQARAQPHAPVQLQTR